MNNFPEQWMKDICDELNKAGITVANDAKASEWESNNFENSIELMKNYVTLSNNIYQHLNLKGLVNRGYCPITGEKIGYGMCTRFLKGRFIYLSEVNNYARNGIGNRTSKLLVQSL